MLPYARRTLEFYPPDAKCVSTWYFRNYGPQLCWTFWIKQKQNLEKTCRKINSLQFQLVFLFFFFGVCFDFFECFFLFFQWIWQWVERWWLRYCHNVETPQSGRVQHHVLWEKEMARGREEERLRCHFLDQSFKKLPGERKFRCLAGSSWWWGKSPGSVPCWAQGAVCLHLLGASD